jgi:outer membrane lipoprotein SlyB
MNTRNVVTAISALTLLTTVGAAHAAGCLKGAVVGGVAGHVAGHHAAIGAVGGCIVGHHYAKEKEKERAVAVSQRPAVARS